MGSVRGKKIQWTDEDYKVLCKYPELRIKDISRQLGYSEDAVRNRLLATGKIDIYDVYEKGLVDFVVREYATHSSNELAEACGVSKSTIKRIAIGLNLMKAIDIVEDGKKLCLNCNEWKPEEEFIAKHNRKKTSYCIECTKIKSQQRYYDYKEKVRLSRADNNKGRSPKNVYKFIDGIEHKQCKQCGELVPLAEYNYSSSTLDGKVNKCKKCIKFNKTLKNNENKGD